MKKAKFKTWNIILLVVILLLIIPQTRHPLQLLLHKGLSYINQSSLINDNERITVAYNDWELKSDSSDSVLNFKTTKGQVVFVNFWATWCPPCIVEMPSLQALYNDYNDKVVFLFITEDDFRTVENFKIKNNYNFKVFNHRGTVPSELLTTSIPRTFIINKKGEIVVDESGALDWNSNTVREQLNQLLYE